MHPLLVLLLSLSVLYVCSNHISTYECKREISVNPLNGLSYKRNVVNIQVDESLEDGLYCFKLSCMDQVKDLLKGDIQLSSSLLSLEINDVRSISILHRCTLSLMKKNEAEKCKGYSSSTYPFQSSLKKLINLASNKTNRNSKLKEEENIKIFKSHQDQGDGYTMKHRGGKPYSLLLKRKQAETFAAVQDWLPKKTVKYFASSSHDSFSSFIELEGEGTAGKFSKDKTEESIKEKKEKDDTFKTSIPTDTPTGQAINSLLVKFHDSLLLVGSNLKEEEKLVHYELLKNSKNGLDNDIREVLHSDRKNKERGLVLSLIEVHDKVTSLLEVGVRSKEIFALVVDNIMNMMPEIIVQLMIMLFAPIIMQLLADIFICILGPILIPSTGSVGCEVQGSDGFMLPVVKKPKPVCTCSANSGAANFKSNRKEQSFNPRRLPLFLQINKSLGSQCPCNHENAVPVPASLLESYSFSGVDMDEGLGVSVPGFSSAGSGLLAKMEPKLKDAIVNGLKSSSLPAVEAGLHSKLSESALDTVYNSVLRNTARSITTSLGRGLHYSILSSLVGNLTHTLVSNTTAALTASLTSSLTHSITPIVALGMSHDPHSDYFCYYCTKYEVYCSDCHQMAKNDGVISADSHYFSSFFSSYYGGKYSSPAINDDIVNFVMEQNQN